MYYGGTGYDGDPEEVTCLNLLKAPVFYFWKAVRKCQRSELKKVKVDVEMLNLEWVFTRDETGAESS